MPLRCGNRIRSGLLMLFIAGLLVVLIAAVIVPRLRPFIGDTDLGWMSDRWLAEQRASRFTES